MSANTGQRVLEQRHVSMEWQTAWDIIQQEMVRRSESLAALMNEIQRPHVPSSVFRREPVSVPLTMAGSVSGIRRYEVGPITMNVDWSTETGPPAAST